jgi:sulfur carrier protein
MELVINGHQRIFATLSSSSTVFDLVKALELKLDRVAIEQNGSIVARPQWQTTPINSGDRMEIVHFVGGGCKSKSGPMLDGVTALGIGN